MTASAAVDQPQQRPCGCTDAEPCAQHLQAMSPRERQNWRHRQIRQSIAERIVK